VIMRDGHLLRAGGGRANRGRAIAALLVGLLLIALALRLIIREETALRFAISEISSAPAWMFVAMFVLPLGNLLLTAATFWVLTNHYGRVRYAEMTALIASAWLLSAFGMFGRIAYHKVMHGVPVRASLRILVVALASSAVSVVMLLVLTWAGSEWLRLNNLQMLGLLSAPAVTLGVASYFARCRWISLRNQAPPTPPELPRGHAVTDNVAQQHWRTLSGLAFRYLDMCVWAARYALVFALVFKPISAAAASGLAASAQAAMLMPVQLGLREWVVGLVASRLPNLAGAAGIDARSLSPGLLADLANRGAEMALAIPLGTVATLVLWTRWRSHHAPARAD